MSLMFSVNVFVQNIQFNLCNINMNMNLEINIKKAFFQFICISNPEISIQ